MQNMKQLHWINKHKFYDFGENRHSLQYNIMFDMHVIFITFKESVPLIAKLFPSRTSFSAIEDYISLSVMLYYNRVRDYFVFWTVILQVIVGNNRAPDSA